MAALARGAQAKWVSVAEFIHRTVTDRLRDFPRGSKRDPFDAITSLVDSDETDLASHVDQILYR